MLGCRVGFLGKCSNFDASSSLKNAFIQVIFTTLKHNMNVINSSSRSKGWVFFDNFAIKSTEKSKVIGL